MELLMSIKLQILSCLCLLILSCSKNKLDIKSIDNKISQTVEQSRSIASTNPASKSITYNKFDNIRSKLKSISTFKNVKIDKNIKNTDSNQSADSKSISELLILDNNQNIIDNPQFKIGTLKFSLAQAINVDMENLVNAFEQKKPFKIQISKSEFVELIPVNAEESSHEIILSGVGAQNINGRSPYFKIFLNESGITGGFFKLSKDEFQLIQDDKNLYLAKVQL